MSYVVLARKYRPRTLSQLVGQDVLVRILCNSIIAGRISHSFLLTGTRGIGKTTTARIMAKMLNCLTPERDGRLVNPCNRCENCELIDSSEHPDVLEFDAASHTGVHDIRDVIDNIHYAPNLAKYRVYIVDEVHMLSTSAFNALLKSLEEPPDHVIWILATTELHKIPVTIVSRCQNFSLERVKHDLLCVHIINILAMEEYKITEAGASIIADKADGSVRDALSITEMIVNYVDGKLITEHEVRTVLGIPDTQITISLLKAVISGNASVALNLFNEMYDKGIDSVSIFIQLLKVVNKVTQMIIGYDDKKSYQINEHFLKLCKDTASQLSIHAVDRLYSVLFDGIQKIKIADDQRSSSIMLIVRLTHLSTIPSIDTILNQHNTKNAEFLHDQQHSNDQFDKDTTKSFDKDLPNMDKSQQNRIPQNEEKLVNKLKEHFFFNNKHIIVK